MNLNPQQHDLFSNARSLPEGLQYRSNFISAEQEQALLASFATLEFKQARYKAYTARRRIVNFGAGYDFESNEVTAAPAIPEFLDPLRNAVADWLKIYPSEFVQALISEYQPGTPLGWHRDVPEYELVAGISLASDAHMRFRPYPPLPDKRAGVFSLELERRSAYVLAREARWQWQHSVPATPALRYSITFRTKNLAMR